MVQLIWGRRLPVGGGRMPEEAFAVRHLSGRERFQRRFVPLFLTLLLAACAAAAQTCLAAPDMEAPTRAALESTAQHFFGMSAHGDIAGLRQNSIAALAANFGGVETAVTDNAASFAGAHATARPPFLL